jgi:DUF971 family protein
MQDVKPTGITLNQSQATLEITWSDGATCRYPLSHLREACPCVECRGGHQFMGIEHAPDNILKLVPKRSYAVKSLHAVGNYALQPVWDDGHHTGIYSWEYLRYLCPPTETTED